jgi:peroxiredoxin
MFLGTHGRIVELRELYCASPSQLGLALAFLRHFGCPFCKEHARALNRQRDAFRAARVDIVMIGTGTVEEADAFRQELSLRDPVFTDPDGAAYRAFGLVEAPLRSLLDPRVLAGGARAAMKGFLPQRPQGRPLQLPGQFLIDRSGTIRSVSRPRLMSDIPAASALLADARALVENPA